MRQVLKQHQLFLVCFLVVLGSLLACAGAAQAANAGKFIFVSGKVWVISSTGEKHLAKKGAVVREGDTIVSGKRAYAQLLMEDEGFIAVRPDTRMRIDVFRYHGREDGTERSVISLIKGCFRAITGFIGHTHKENYKVKTPVASIGIRGTDHEPMFIPVPAPGEISVGEPGAYDKVNVGEAYIQNEAGMVIIVENQVGFAPDATTMPVSLAEMPAFYKTSSTPENQEEEEGEEEAAEAEEKEQEEAPVSEEEGAAAAEEEGEALDTTATTEGLTTTMGEEYEINQAIIGETEEGSTVDLTNQEETDPSGSTTPIGSETPIGSGTYASTWEPGVSGGVSWPYSTWRFTADEDEIQQDGAGNLTGWTYDDPHEGSDKSVQIINPTSSSHGYAGQYSETGIEFGTWQADYVRVTWADGSSYDYDVYSGFVHWITGPEAPGHLSQVLTGTATYSLDGWTAPTCNLGAPGTLNYASLTADFTYQTVTVGLDLTVNSINWEAQANAIPLDEQDFFASTDSTYSPLTVWRDGSSANTWGMLQGSLTGEGLNGAVLSYSFEDYMYYETVNGTAAFIGTSQNANTSYRIVGFAAYDPRSLTETALKPTLIEGGANAPSRLATNASGNLLGFDSYLRHYDTYAMKVQDLPVRLDGTTCTLTDTGQDPTTGIIWGRWSNGSSANIATLRSDGTAVAPQFNPPDLHYICTPEMSTPVMLPVSGTYQYTLVGGTSPTDNWGNVGTLNSASLTANFTAMTVDAGVNATVGSLTFGASASGMPIENGAGFGAGIGESTPLNVTCSGSGAGTSHSGKLGGVFAGATGEGAGIVYSLNTTGAVDTTVSGVAAFRR